MRPLWRKFKDRLLNDELAVRRWGRSIVMGLSVAGLQYGDALAAELGPWVKPVCIGLAMLAVAITAGEKNPKPERPT